MQAHAKRRVGWRHSNDRKFDGLSRDGMCSFYNKNQGMQLRDLLVGRLCDGPSISFAPSASPWMPLPANAQAAGRFLHTMASLFTLLRPIAWTAMLRLQHCNPNICFNLPFMSKCYLLRCRVPHRWTTLIDPFVADLPQDTTERLLIRQLSCCCVRRPSQWRMHTIVSTNYTDLCPTLNPQQL